MLRFLIAIALLIPACAPSEEPSPPEAEGASKAADEIRPAVCDCSIIDPELGGCPDGDLDGDCVCSGEDNCPGVPNCDRANADGDAFGDLCDIMPNTPNPEGTIAAMQADIALLAAALSEIRAKYPDHFHGLLGLGGDPVGDSGNLSYSLPGE